MKRTLASCVLGLALVTTAWAADGTEVIMDGLRSKTPEAWKEKPATNKMRFKQFELPAAPGDKEDAELTIFFFGAGSGGTAEENIKRWKGFFTTDSGKSVDEVAKVEKLKVAGSDVTYLDVTGTYLFSAQPFNPNAPKTKKPNFRMLGVVFESPNGPYFMRLTGPATTVGQHKKGFDEWLKAFKK